MEEPMTTSSVMLLLWPEGDDDGGEDATADTDEATRVSVTPETPSDIAD
jgi:hypothetical protein